MLSVHKLKGFVGRKRAKVKQLLLILATKYLTRMRVMLNCIVRTTTRISSPPKVISVKFRSLNQVTFFSVCKKKILMIKKKKGCTNCILMAHNQ